MLILDGKEVAKARRQGIQAEAEAFKKKKGRPPGLGVVLVGEDPASQVYVRNKIKSCAEVGFFSKEVLLSEKVSQQELEKAIQDLNEDSAVDGFLIQLPLPKTLDADRAIAKVSPNKDADGLTAENVGLFWLGRPRAVPCTPAGVMAILEHYSLRVRGMKAVVVGRSQIVGRPMAQLLLQADATVTIAHSKTADLAKYTREADLVVVAAGRPEFLGREDFKQGAVVVDVGIHRVKDEVKGTRLCGDVRFRELEGWIQACTPVPGGVGPMTITMLLENTLRLAKASLD